MMVRKCVWAFYFKVVTFPFITSCGLPTVLEFVMACWLGIEVKLSISCSIFTNCCDTGDQRLTLEVMFYQSTLFASE